MGFHMEPHEKTRSDECFAKFRASARSLVKDGLARHTPDHEVRLALRNLQRDLESELVDIFGAERAEKLGIALESDPRVIDYVVKATARLG